MPPKNISPQSKSPASQATSSDTKDKTDKSPKPKSSTSSTTKPRSKTAKDKDEDLEDTSVIEEEKVVKKRPSKIVRRKGTSEESGSGSEPQSGEEDSPTKSHWTRYSEDLLKTDYLKEIIEEGEYEDEYYCTLCERNYVCNGLIRHLKTKKHKNNTPEEDREQLALSIAAYKKKEGQNGQEPSGRDREDKRDYLEFVGLLLSMKLSYSQIEKLGSYMADLALANRLTFLKGQSFAQEKVSKIATDCFRPYLLQNIFEDIKKTKYSISIDASTIASQSLCAMQVKYLKQEISSDKVAKSVIVDRTIGISTFKETSTADIYLKMLNDKVLDHSGVRDNLIGVAHDFASTLSDGPGGLIINEGSEPEISTISRFRGPLPCF